jgi:amidohydrolase
MDLDALNREVEKLRPQLVAWRRQFHEYPELHLECHQTAPVVAEHLKVIDLHVETGIAKTGGLHQIRFLR